MIGRSAADGPCKGRGHAKLESLLSLGESATCRRQRLLAYFGEASAPCGNCDVCLSPPRTWDGTEAARKALSCVYRTGQRYGAGHLIDVLRGEVTAKVVARGHQDITTFGIGSEFDEKRWRTVFRQLVARELVSVDHERYNALRLTDAARPVLRGEAVFHLRVERERSRAKRRGNSLKSPDSLLRATTARGSRTLQSKGARRSAK